MLNIVGVLISIWLFLKSKLNPELASQAVCPVLVLFCLMVLYATDWTYFQMYSTCLSSDCKDFIRGEVDPHHRPWKYTFTILYCIAILKLIWVSSIFGFKKKSSTEKILVFQYWMKLFMNAGQVLSREFGQSMLWLGSL